jgi:hypothetical protein
MQRKLAESIKYRMNPLREAPVPFHFQFGDARDPLRLAGHFESLRPWGRNVTSAKAAGRMPVSFQTIIAGKRKIFDRFAVLQNSAGTTDPKDLFGEDICNGCHRLPDTDRCSTAADCPGATATRYRTAW